MCNKSELHIILSTIAKAYQDIYGSNVSSIMLYGSYARGDNGQDSDIDIVAIVHGERQDLQAKLKQIWDLSSDLELEYGVIVSPTVIPYAEYERFKDDIPYYRNIQNEGVRIVA